MSGLAHWDCWGSCGMRHTDTPTLSSTSEVAMARLLEDCRLIYGKQDWSTARYAVSMPPVTAVRGCLSR